MTDTLFIVLQTCLLSQDVHPCQGAIYIQPDSIIIKSARHNYRVKRDQIGSTFYLNPDRTKSIALYPAGVSYFDKKEDRLEMWNVYLFSKLKNN
jgi:hypothetical protein